MHHKSIASDIDLNSMDGSTAQQKAYKDQQPQPQPQPASFEKITATAGTKSYRPGSAYW